MDDKALQEELKMGQRILDHNQCEMIIHDWVNKTIGDIRLGIIPGLNTNGKLDKAYCLVQYVSDDILNIADLINMGVEPHYLNGLLISINNRLKTLFPKEICTIDLINLEDYKGMEIKAVVSDIISKSLTYEG